MSIRIVAPGSHSGRGQLVLIREESGQEEERLEVTIPGEHTFSLPAGSWRLHLKARGFWSRRDGLTVVGGSNALAADILAFPTGFLSGRLQRGGAGAFPAAVAVRFAPPWRAPRRDAPSGTIDCPVSGTVWTCEVPAGTHDIRVSAEGFVPQYHWSNVVDAAMPKALGTMILRRGSSVSGWVEKEGQEGLGPRCRVSLVPEHVAREGAAIDPSLAGLVRTVAPSSAGLFLFEGVPAGNYVVRAEEPGWAPAEQAHVHVELSAPWEGTTALVLSRPAKVVVQVEPARDPQGHAWRVRLAGSPTLWQEGRVSKDGEAVFSNVTPGSQRLFVLDDLDAAWLTREIDVVAQMEPLRLQLSALRVEGRLLLGDEPAAGTLRLTSTEGEAEHLLQADGEGRFAGHVTRVGQWELAVKFDGDESWLPQAPIDLAADESGIVKLVVSVADSTLTGEVLDGAGRPVANARVYARRHAAGGVAASASTEGSGRFAIRGLPVGAISVRAAREGSESPWIKVDMEAEVPVHVRLVLEAQFHLKGKVLAAGQPLAGAGLLLVPLVDRGFPAPLLSEGTDAEGNFSAVLPPVTRGVRFAASAPAAPTLLGLLPRSEATVVITLPAERGTLTVDFPQAAAMDAWLVAGGAHFPVPILAELQRGPGQPGTLTLDVAPGDYSLCFSEDARAAVLAGLPHGSLCATTTVAPGAAASLRAIPEPGQR